MPVCGICRLAKKRCDDDCICALYFPASERQKAEHVFQIFGAKKTSDILKAVNPIERPRAVISLAYEAGARVNDPVGGCHEIILDLERTESALQET